MDPNVKLFINDNNIVSSSGVTVVGILTVVVILTLA